MLKRQAGFIITLELLLVTTILIIGLSIGIVQVRDALIKRQAVQQSRQITVVDSQNRKLGRTYGLDEHDAPLVAYVDNSVPSGANNDMLTGRAFIGIRDDRFTSREPVFYDAPNCTGNPCLKGVSDEAYNLSVGGVAQAGSVSYINALQGNINYAIGRASGNSLQGVLMRSSQQICPVDISQIQSVYVSQKVTSGMPCQIFTKPELEADNSCLVNISGDSTIEVTDIRNGSGKCKGIDNKGCVEEIIRQPSTCDECPAGSSPQGDLLDNYLPDVELVVNDALKLLSSVGLIEQVDVTLGELCCPDSSKISDQAALTDALVFVALEQTLSLLGIDLRSQTVIVDLLASVGINPGEVYCTPDVKLHYADSVTIDDTSTINVLEQFTSPFSVVVPQRASSDWYHVPPNGEGNLYIQPDY